MFNPKEIEILEGALKTLAAGWSGLQPFEPDLDWAAIASVVQKAAVRMQDNYPYAHPLYAGQMLKPPHPVARLPPHSLRRGVRPKPAGG